MASHAPAGGGNNAQMGEKEKIAALIMGDEAKRTALGVAAGETLEDIVAEVAGERLSGIPFLVRVLKLADSRWTRFGLNALSHGAAAAIGVKIASVLPATVDAHTRSMIGLLISDFVAGFAKGVITASDPAKRAEAIDRLAEASAKRFDVAFRDQVGFIHLAQRQADGTARLDDKGRPVSCVHWQSTVAGWDLSHPGHTTKTGGGKNGSPPTVVHSAAAPIPFTSGSLETLITPGAAALYCPACFPQGQAQPQAQKGFWERVAAHPEVSEVLAAAALRDAQSGREGELIRDLLQDLAKTGDFHAIKIVCGEIRPRLVSAKKADGTHDHFLISEEDAKLLRNWLAGPGGAGLETLNKLSEAAHGFVDAFLHKWHAAKGWDTKVFVALGVAVPIGYVLFAVVTLLFIVAGACGQYADPGKNIDFMAIGGLMAILWLTPWYTVSGVGAVFYNVFHPSEDGHGGTTTMANMARSITALIMGIISIDGLFLNVGTFFLGIETGWIRSITTLIMVVGFIGYNRLGSLWVHGPHAERMADLLERLALGSVRALSLIATLQILFGLTAMQYTAYLRKHTVFPVSIEKRDVSGKPVFYVPTPDGKVFRPEDVFGWVKAKELEEAMGSGSRLVACLTPGTEVDLPGYSEQKTDFTLSDGSACVQLAIHANPFGWQFGGGATAYSTLEALAAVSRIEETELNAVLEASLVAPGTPAPASAEPGETQRTAAPNESVPRATPGITGKGAVDCAKLSPRAASRAGCKK